MADLSLEGAELDASREAFEADFSSRYPFQLQRTEGNGGDYSSPFASVAWQSWQAAEARGMERAAAICDQQAKEPECPERAAYCADAVRAAIGADGGSEHADQT